MIESVVFSAPHARVALARGITGLGMTPDALLVNFADGRRVELSNAQLYGDAADRFDALSGQRLGDAVAGGDECHGESVGLRVHSLQCAELARSAGFDAPLTAAAFVERLFGASRARQIRFHVEAKRYLVAAQPDCLQALSNASRETPTLQGGPMSPAHMRVCESGPGFADAITLRRIDDQAKDRLAKVAALDSYRALLLDLALGAMQTEPT